jgi:hypothetical protein
MKTFAALAVPGIVLLAVLASWPRACSADQLVTKTGETLQGVVVKETPEGIEFDSRAFGRLMVPREVILRLERAPEVPAAQQAPEPKEAAPAAAAAATPEPGTIDRVGAFLARINPLKGWKSSFNLGFTARRGEDSDNNLYLRFRSERKADDGDEHLIESRYDYAEDVLQDGVKSKTDELLTASYQYRHDLAKSIFLQSNSSYYRDAITELDHEVTQTGGIGYRWRREWWNTSLTPAAGVRWRDIDGDTAWQFVVGAYQDLEIRFASTLTLRETLRYLVAPDNQSDYSARLGIELSQKLSKVWALGLRYDYYYDAVVGKDASRLQQRWAATLGLEF